MAGEAPRFQFFIRIGWQSSTFNNKSVFSWYLSGSSLQKLDSISDRCFSEVELTPKSFLFRNITLNTTLSRINKNNTSSAMLTPPIELLVLIAYFFLFLCFCRIQLDHQMDSIWLTFVKLKNYD